MNYTHKEIFPFILYQKDIRLFIWAKSINHIQVIQTIATVRDKITKNLTVNKTCFFKSKLHSLALWKWIGKEIKLTVFYSQLR
jgi:hypothetical protein